MKMPDGLHDDHVRPVRGLSKHASPLSFIILCGLIGAALLGVFGGGHNAARTTNGDAVRLMVNMPTVIRNGEFFEARITITPLRDMQDLTLAISPSLWRDLTMNSMVPQATDEKFEDGAFRFSYGKAEAGKPLLVKLDFQINPSLFGGTAGTIGVYDGKQKLVEQPMKMKVRP